jgi:hypothetical protein
VTISQTSGSFYTTTRPQFDSITLTPKMFLCGGGGGGGV